MIQRTPCPISKNPNFSLYDISPQIQDFRAYILSTPETRNLTTNPFLVGKEYRNALGNAIKKTLSHEELKRLYKNEPDEKLNVLHLLRGGLNFEILDALGNLGKNKARASFMSSERAKKQGAWTIQDDQYTKLNLANNSTLFIGDIVATGITLRVALAKITELHSGLTYPTLPDFVKEYTKESAQEMKKQLGIKRIVMFTLGCEKTEKTLIKYHELFKKILPNFEGTTLVFIEGLFHMACDETKARIKINGTDLMPWHATLAPEFEQELYNIPTKALERCIVYDGGSRGFHPSNHFKDILEYAKQVEEELLKGATIYDLILDRWENAETLPEHVKSELKNPETGNRWISQRIEQIKAQILN